MKVKTVLLVDDCGLDQKCPQHTSETNAAIHAGVLYQNILLNI